VRSSQVFSKYSRHYSFSLFLRVLISFCKLRIMASLGSLSMLITGLLLMNFVLCAYLVCERRRSEV